VNSLPRICVSDNARFLVTEANEPFFWLGDTAWELFHRLTRQEARDYLQHRQQKRFTVIQAVVLAEFDGLTLPNQYGHLPLIENDPARPNEAYFEYVDELVQMAAEHELYVGLLPTWGDKVYQAWGVGPVVFTPDKARQYGEFLGERYRRQSNIIWILGGDRAAVSDEQDYRPIWRALAAGIDAGAGFRALKTYHPMGRHSSSAWLHDEDWLDVNMLQSGHGSGRDTPTWDMIAQDYARTPAKPTLDGEPNYEDHPVNPWRKWEPANGYYRDDDVRKQLYRSVFAGGCGVTYGHHSVWQFYSPRVDKINHADRTWIEALDRPGASQAQFLRRLMEARPYLTRIPDQSLLLSDAGERGDHVQATRDDGGRYAFVYIPNASQTVERDLRRLRGNTLRSWWYNPRDGSSSEIGELARTALRAFTSPAEGPDWVLILDDTAQGYAAPGG